MAKLKTYPVTICGAGALGANLAENLVRSGFDMLKVIDRDRIEERNLSTQPYYRSDLEAPLRRLLSLCAICKLSLVSSPPSASGFL